MNTEPTLTLFHTTNRVSADRMLVEGLGLNLDDYAKLYAQVKDYFNLSDEYLGAITPERVPEVEQGVVCLYATLEEAVQARYLATLGGRYRGGYVERLVRHAGEVLKLPYTQLEVVTQTIVGGLSEAVVVVVKLTPSQLLEPSKIKGSSPIKSKNKIACSAICKVLSLV